MPRCYKNTSRPLIFEMQKSRTVQISLIGCKGTKKLTNLQILLQKYVVFFQNTIS